MAFQVSKDVPIVGFGEVLFSFPADPPLPPIREAFRGLEHEAAGMLFKIVHGFRWD
jgi:DNA-binding LacI/PurR family transcriptional regulator